MTIFDNQQLQFPQHLDIKIIIDADIAIENSKRNIGEALDKCNTPFNFVNIRTSAKGRYFSYTYNVILENKLQMDNVYNELNHIPGLKFAL